MDEIFELNYNFRMSFMTAFDIYRDYNRLNHPESSLLGKTKFSRIMPVMFPQSESHLKAYGTADHTFYLPKHVENKSFLFPDELFVSFLTNITIFGQ